jgi:hypothetical protein
MLWFNSRTTANAGITSPSICPSRPIALNTVVAPEAYRIAPLANWRLPAILRAFTGFSQQWFFRGD